ncbi:DODA-type extradiol aromatic ring-opening family dioxygenase [Paenibacillus pinistramenti]|uniref:DODA-type extradiol aromatic ring-opening family dioxygenase n=1 Tax=Paenibacillus pinistramenti TaxID=1768003 RepID=UPI001109D77B|nr:class III extradiol ring-cleavage dioxygenase [Paenibacillus pinistramenti]
MISPLFLAHGSPMLAIEDKSYTRFLKQLGAELKPDAIVIFTAHWETETITVSSHNEVYETIYDFYGFPDELYTLKYPAKGSTAAAKQVTDFFTEHGIQWESDQTRGLDHGSWTMLYHMFPAADVPVVQISVNPFLSPAVQHSIGAALKELSNQNILVIGSGVTVHNLRAVNWDADKSDAWAVEFDEWLVQQMKENQLQKLFRYRTEAPYAELAVPRAEHFVPLFIAMGAGDLSRAQVIYRDYEFGNLSYMCLSF